MATRKQEADATSVKDGEPSDFELLRRAWEERDRSATGLFDSRWSGRLTAFALTVLAKKADVDDCVQETVYKAAISLGQLKDRTQGGFESWILSICRNAAYELNRKQKKRLLPLAIDPPDRLNGKQPVDAAIREEELHCIKEWLADQSNFRRYVWGMYFCESWSQRDIAEAAGCSQTRIAKELERALAGVRKKLKKEGLSDKDE